MSSPSHSGPTERFAGLAQVYARYRPSYPADAVEYVVSRCRLGSGSLLVDVGSGTGISSRLFAARGIRVIGLEPNAEMRAEANSSGAELQPRYVHGAAEATGLAAESADAVLAAQAFHWFDPERALPEFHRILKLGGWVVLMWNERDETDSFTAAYGAVIRSLPEAAAVEVPRARAGEALLRSALFDHGELRAFPNAQVLDEDGLLGRAFSASYAPHAGEAADAFAASVRSVFRRFQRDGNVALRYSTSVYSARRKAAC